MEELRAQMEHQSSGDQSLSNVSVPGVEGRLDFSEAAYVSGSDPNRGMPEVEWFEASAPKGEGPVWPLQYVSADVPTSFTQGDETSNPPLSSFSSQVDKSAVASEVAPSRREGATCPLKMFTSENIFVVFIQILCLA